MSGEKYLRQLSREYKVSHTAISNWREAYQAKGEAAFFSNENQERSVEVLEGRVAELERFCGQLALENSVLLVLHGKTMIMFFVDLMASH